MLKHKWKSNKCSVCGITRKKMTRKTLMAIVNHPPWEAYQYEYIYKYFLGNGTETWERPQCVNDILHGKQ